jgi:16S rRNA (cytidine1402-2'-O)-methyltransferase
MAMTTLSDPLSAGLWLVSTPIGNAGDITKRALDILARADVLAAEDTRTLRHLMQIHGLSPGNRPLVALHDHSGAAAVARLAAAVAEGRSVAYASDAGTPLISDPGFTLARAVRAAGGAVSAAPGASAVLAALAVSGLPADRFLFLGFLPATSAARRAALAEVAALPFTLIIYEAPHRVQETLDDLVHSLGGARAAAICRELTKRFEEVRHGALADLLSGQIADPARGEIVLVIAPPQAIAPSGDEVRQALRQALASMRVRDAARTVAEALGLPQREVYRIALTLKGGPDVD